MASLIAGAGVLGIYGLLTHGDAWATKRSDRHDGARRRTPGTSDASASAA